MNILLQVRDSQVQNFIYASSSSIYGNSKETPFHENLTNLSPISLYGATKLANEILVKATLLNHQTKSRGIRFFTVYGEMGRPDMAYFRILKSLFESKPFPLYGNDNLLRDFTYIGDAIESLLLLSGNLETKDYGFADVVNIGGGSPRTLRDMIVIFEQLTGEKLLIESKDSFPTDVLQTIASRTYQEELIGTTPTTSLEDGLDRFFSWSMQPLVRERFSTWST
jgi:UDP-glucuronate 4-epimerase